MWFFKRLTMSGLPMVRLWVAMPQGFTHTRMCGSSYKISKAFVIICDFSLTFIESALII